jgi:hypothetical protein
MRQLKWMFALALVVGLFVSPALAYDRPTGTVYAGYSLLKDSDIDDVFTTGFVGDLTLNVGESLAVPLEFSWHSQTYEGVDLSVLTYMGGLRLGGKVYTQFLAGAAKAEGGSASTTRFAIQPGIGIDMDVTDKLSIRVGGDYRLIMKKEDEDENATEWRGHAGLVFSFGGY